MRRRERTRNRPKPVTSVGASNRPAVGRQRANAHIETQSFLFGDFREWKKHDAYMKAFERLLRDLGKESH